MTTTVVGAAGAQVAVRTCTMAGAPFTLTDGAAWFHVALDDDGSQPGVIVLMRFIDQNGTVVRSSKVSIAAGGSATLNYRGTGLYRVQAEIFDVPRNFWSDRRVVVGSVEVVPNIILSPIADRPVGPGPWLIPCGLYKQS